MIKGLQLPLSGLATENHYKDSFDGSEAGLFASNIANKADVCAETSKKKMCHTYCTNAHGLDSVACPFCQTGLQVRSLT